VQSADLLTIRLSSPVADSPRVEQVRGLFDLSPSKTSEVAWTCCLPRRLAESPWNVGLIVGPSGCGKSTTARHLWPDAFRPAAPPPPDRAVVDLFPPEMSVKEVTALLSSVGFSSPPAWLRPFPVLSTGQQFRVNLALLLASAPSPCVADEFTSVVDRTVACIGSAALARTVRSRDQQFVAVTCHEDVEPWLQPDWVYRPAEDLFQWRSLQRRPPVQLTVVRCAPSAWPLFSPHHYLSSALTPGAACFLATWEEQPVAFSAWLRFFGSGPKAMREHRTVTLPDYQGVGIGSALSAWCASLWRGLGFRALSTTTHPALIASRTRSPLWRMHRAPSLAGRSAARERHMKHATTRLTAGFEYVGPPLPGPQARLLLHA
jgi:GNAT superfamily N-acetyltransferase